MQMVGPWGRYLPQWLRAPGNGSGPAICQHTHTHTHTHWTLPTTMSVLETPFDIHVSSVYQTHTCMQAPVSTLCISAKKTHNKGSRTRPIMSTLMPRSGIPVICSRATLSCDSSYCICENKDEDDKLRGNRAADQHLCFCYIDSTILLLSKSEISNRKPSSEDVQLGLCQTWSETLKTGFLVTLLIWKWTCPVSKKCS